MERIVRALASATSEQGEVVVQHEAALSRVALFPRGEYCISWTIEMAQNGFDSWKVQLAMLETALHEHAAHCGRANHGDDARGYPADAASAPFDAVPIPINAVLAEARLPLARIASLRPGDLIPLPLQREVPLRIGRDTIAHGSVGTLDDRVALQLTRIA
jgi:flagellar motor switch protein FliM